MLCEFASIHGNHPLHRTMMFLNPVLKSVQSQILYV
uniref:Uncharacterized protein n=1 Tax=Anguilla anguilla TaxID=7936 RepID=A0A0E9RP67_ANGAN